MKRTLFIAMLAAVLSGEQGFARAYIPTEIDGATSFASHSMAGVYSSSEAVFFGNVTIRKGGDSGLYSTSVYGGYATGRSYAAYKNRILMSGGEVNSLVGGHSEWCDAHHNTVILTGGVVNEIKGGMAFGEDALKDAADNVVILTGGQVRSWVYGGESFMGDAYNNSIHLVGSGATAAIADAEGHVARYSGSMNGIEVLGISGGSAGAGSSYANSLSVYGTNITLGALYDVQSLNFYLTPTLRNGDTMLTLTDESRTDLSNVAVSVKCSGNTKLTQGDTVTLIRKEEGELITTGMSTEVDVIKGVSATYTGTVSVEDNDLVLTIGEGTPTVDGNALKSMTETRTAVAALGNAAADFMADTGRQQAKLAAAAGKDGAAPFVALGGSHLRYNTGSHVNTNGFNAALGWAKTVNSVTWGLAGEYGRSDYKSYVGSVRGKGDGKLYGGALLADWQGRHGWHAEGAVRMGRTHAGYSAMLPLGYTHYSDRASYQGCVIGCGKELKVSAKDDDFVDVYARYMFNHTNGGNATASSGEALHFSGVNSHRTMVGARYHYSLSDHSTLYVGAAWLHEFDGDARAVIGGFSSPSPSLKGSSGMVEIGTNFAPFASKRVLLNLNVQGWTGVQRGISGGAGCCIRF